MENKSYLIKTDEFENNQIKECIYCNAILPLSEYDDHIFCHQVDSQENGEINFNINNYGLQLNNNNSNINNGQNNSNPQDNNNSNINNGQNNSNPEDNNNINHPYIDPESLRLNSINVINENNNQAQNNNINNNIINNINNNNNAPPNSNEESFIDKIKNYFIPSNNSNINNKSGRDIMNLPYDQLSLEERAERNRIEEQKAYEKKILGIANSESPEYKIIDNRTTSEKITDFVQNNSYAILATIDIIGCLTLHTPSIGRTIMRVGNLIGSTYHNFTANRNNNQNNNMEDNEYNNLIRNHPELRRKDRDIETIIKFLPVSEVKEIKINQENNNSKCIICLSDFEIGDQVSALPCLHVFHTDCIASWLRKHCQCPVCKYNITLKSLIGGV